MSAYWTREERENLKRFADGLRADERLIPDRLFTEDAISRGLATVDALEKALERSNAALGELRRLNPSSFKVKWLDPLEDGDALLATLGNK